MPEASSHVVRIAVPLPPTPLEIGRKVVAFVGDEITGALPRLFDALHAAILR